MNKPIFTLVLYLIFTLSAAAQSAPQRNLFNHLDAGITVGTTGLGLELSTPATDYLRIRAGVDWMPRFTVPMTFNIDSYRDGTVLDTDFGELQSFMKKLSGFDVDRDVHVDGKPMIWNLRFMVDVYPWRENRRWHLTAGFFYGTDRAATAVNTIEEMPSMLAIGIFNNLHDYVLSTDFMEEPIYNDIYLSPEVAAELKEKMEGYGQLGVHIGDYTRDMTYTTEAGETREVKKGDPYIMKPGSDGLVKAEMFVNRFKPYFGVGYSAPVTADGRLKVAADAGLLLWGGTPKIVTHEGIDLTRDVENVRGKVGDYVDLAKTFKVYPMLSFTLSYTLF